MGILKQRKNKKFGYEPRYYNNDGTEGSPFLIQHKFDNYRSTVGESKNLRAKFKAVLTELKKTSDKKTNYRIFFIFTILILIFLFIIDFDLSIFFKS
jgi:hypothetical protein